MSMHSLYVWYKILIIYKYQQISLIIFDKFTLAYEYSAFRPPPSTPPPRFTSTGNSQYFR